MNRVLARVHPFALLQDSITPQENRPTESVMSLGNGYMGCRGTYEETFSGDSLQGTYIAGVWMPDKTRVGWWKIGYPRYYGKVINAPHFLTFDLWVGGKQVDLATVEIASFSRSVDMEHGIMERKMTLATPSGRIEIQSSRLFSLLHKELATFTYQVTALDDVGEVEIRTGIDANVSNTDANYEEQFWLVHQVEEGEHLYVETQTIPNTFGTPQFHVGITAAVLCDSPQAEQSCTTTDRSIQRSYRQTLRKGDHLKLEKFVTVVTDRNHSPQQLKQEGQQRLALALSQGLAHIQKEQARLWEARWQKCDVTIEGDDAAQQGIRFNLFHLWSTYDGTDPRLNIGPKGFTGEKYGGAAYYDTEGYCFPMYLATSQVETARNLLLFRYHTLEKAKENAGKIGMKGALYPMVTFNGEECHNEWEITFEELHRNAAVVYAIYCYTQYTGDTSYIREYGIHVMMEVARFWACRANYHKESDQYMLLGVTGPNEYENNINNNFLTNFMAKWCIEFALSYVEEAGYTLDPAEGAHLAEVAEKMCLTYDETTKIFLQQDNFFHKNIYPAADIPDCEIPLWKHWSWDRILRSCFIKQADVILAFYYFPSRFTLEQKQKNFRYYEPITVHESSLSPSMYSTVASACGFAQDAYALYQRAARLDLDNFNSDTEDGLHITSMAGAWISIVLGFAGLDYQGGTLSFRPSCPAHWNRLGFRLFYQNRLLSIQCSAQQFTCEILEGDPLNIQINSEDYSVKDKVTIDLR